jgi:hypothetical protein
MLGKNIIHLLRTYTHCTMDHTIDIECLHCVRHCSVIGALSLLFFYQKVLLEALFFVCSVPKVVGSRLTAKPNAIGFDSQPDPRLLGPALS